VQKVSGRLPLTQRVELVRTEPHQAAVTSARRAGPARSEVTCFADNADTQRHFDISAYSRQALASTGPHV